MERAGQLLGLHAVRRAHDLTGCAFFTMVIIALLAQQFFDRLSVLMNPQRGLVSLLSMFLVGLSVLVAAGFILAAVQTGTLAAVSAVGIEALSLVPITVLYARKFEHL